MAATRAPPTCAASWLGGVLGSAARRGRIDTAAAGVTPAPPNPPPRPPPPAPPPPRPLLSIVCPAVTRPSGARGVLPTPRHVHAPAACGGRGGGNLHPLLTSVPFPPPPKPARNVRRGLSQCRLPRPWRRSPPRGAFPLPGRPTPAPAQAAGAAGVVAAASPSLPPPWEPRPPPLPTYHYVPALTTGSPPHSLPAPPLSRNWRPPQRPPRLPPLLTGRRT